jgi:hypothetical protein
MVKARGNKVFLAIKYNPMLGPFTDTWDNLVDDNGRGSTRKNVIFQIASGPILSIPIYLTA